MSAGGRNGGPASEEGRPGPADLGTEDLRPYAISRLPIGRHDLPREFVEENQRNRMMAAALACVGERGYQATSAAQIIKRAGVSNSTFYRVHDGKESCVLAAYDASVEWLEGQVSAAACSAAGWPEGVRLAVARALELLAVEEAVARLCTIEIHFAGVRAEVRHRALIDRLALPLSRGREEGPFADLLPASLETGLLGGSLALVTRRIRDGRGPELAALAPEITEFLLGPYLGTEAAHAAAAG
jgi:AcrR family transcriptional regulator